MPLEPNIERIILTRKLEGYKVVQRELADKLEVSPQQFSLWVRGKSYPRAETLWKLAKELDVKVDDLYNYKEE